MPKHKYLLSRLVICSILNIPQNVKQGHTGSLLPILHVLQMLHFHVSLDQGPFNEVQLIADLHDVRVQLVDRLFVLADDSLQGLVL